MGGAGFSRLQRERIRGNDPDVQRIVRHFMESCDGHSWESWREQLGPGLCWHAELENIRLASRALKGKDDDPDIEKKIIVEGNDQ